VYGDQPQDNVLLDATAMAALFTNLASDATPSAAGASPPTSPPDVPIQVDNGTGRSELAHTTATRLQALGFHIGAVGDARTAATTTISYGPSDLAAAQLLQAQVPGATLLPSTTVGIVLTLGANFTDLNAAATPSTASAVAAPKLTCAP
jgi:hypothetical protein